MQPAVEPFNSRTDGRCKDLRMTSNGQTHGAPYCGHGYVPLRFFLGGRRYEENGTTTTVVKWLQQLSAESCRKVLSSRLGFDMQQLGNSLCQPSRGRGPGTSL